MKQKKKLRTLFRIGRMTVITYLVCWKIDAVFFQVIWTCYARMSAILTKKYAKLTGWEVSLCIPIICPVWIQVRLIRRLQGCHLQNLIMQATNISFRSRAPKVLKLKV